MKRGFFLAVACVTLGASGPRAVTNPEDTTSSQDLESRYSAHQPRQLSDSVVVTAKRFVIDAEKSIWPVEAITLQKLRSQQTLVQALDGTAGVDIRQFSGEGSVATLSNWGLFNRHMVLLYDGRAVKDYSLGGFNLSNYSPEEIERVEMVKGPQSALYGADAVGGVVNLITRSTLDDRVALVSRVGSFNTQLYRLEASQAYGRFGVGGFAETFSTDNHRDNSGVERMVFGLRGDYLSEDNRHEVMISARYFDDSLGVPGPEPDPDFVPVHGNRKSYSLFDHQEDENYSMDVRYRFADENVGEFHVDLFWEKQNLDFNSLFNFMSFYDVEVNPGDTVLGIDSIDTRSRSIYNKRSNGLSGRYLREFADWSLAGGLEWFSGSIRGTQYDTSTGTTIAGPGAGFVYGYDQYNFWKGEQDQYDLWSGVTWDASSLVRFDLGGRVQFIQNRERQPSYNLGVMLRPTEDVSLKFGYGYAFRLPTIAEQFADEFYVAGNEDLGTETSRSIIGRLNWDVPSEQLSVGVTAFYQEVDSLIQYQFDPVTFRSVPVNVEQFDTRGMDVSASWRPHPKLGLVQSLVWQHAAQTTAGGEGRVDAYYVPDLKWRTDLLSNWTTTVSSIVSIAYTDERWIEMFGGSAKSIESVLEIGASLTVEPWDHVRLILSGHDLTDQARPDQFGFSVTDGDYPGPGRRFYLKVTAGVI